MSNAFYFTLPALTTVPTWLKLMTVRVLAYIPTCKPLGPNQLPCLLPNMHPIAAEPVPFALVQWRKLLLKLIRTALVITNVHALNLWTYVIRQIFRLPSHNRRSGMRGKTRAPQIFWISPNFQIRPRRLEQGADASSSSGTNQPPQAENGNEDQYGTVIYRFSC